MVEEKKEKPYAWWYDEEQSKIKINGNILVIMFYKLIIKIISII